MKIENFLKLNTFSDIKKNKIQLLNNYKQIPSWYWDKIAQPPQYISLQYYADMVKMGTIGFYHIQFDDLDEVIFIIQTIEIGGNQRIKISEYPISFFDNYNHIELILSHLFNCLNEKIYMLSSLNLLFLKPELNNSNYYSSYFWREKKLTKAYKHRHKFNRYKDNYSLQFLSSLTTQQKELFIQIRKEWEVLVNKSGSHREFKNSLNYSNSNMLYYIGYYNNQPMVCGVGLITKFGFYIFFEYSKHKIDNYFNNFHLFHKCILQEALFENYKIKNIYGLGFRPGDAGVKEYKERIYENKILCYRINFNDWGKYKEEIKKVWQENIIQVQQA